jgi:hypothetical protein
MSRRGARAPAYFPFEISSRIALMVAITGTPTYCEGGQEWIPLVSGRMQCAQIRLTLQRVQPPALRLRQARKELRRQQRLQPPRPLQRPP